MWRVAEAEAQIREVLSVARALNAHRLAGQALQGVAMARMFSGDAAGARANLLDALAEFEVAGNALGVAEAEANLAEIEFARNEPEAALRCSYEALTVYRSTENKEGTANVLCNIAAYLIALGRFGEARARARESLAVACESSLSEIAATALQHLATIAALRLHADRSGPYEGRARAARLFGFVEKRFGERECLREYTERREYEKAVPALITDLGAARYVELVAEGGRWNEYDAIAEALKV